LRPGEKKKEEVSYRSPTENGQRGEKKKMGGPRLFPSFMDKKEKRGGLWFWVQCLSSRKKGKKRRKGNDDDAFVKKKEGTDPCFDVGGKGGVDAHIEKGEKKGDNSSKHLFVPKRKKKKDNFGIPTIQKGEGGKKGHANLLLKKTLGSLFLLGEGGEKKKERGGGEGKRQWEYQSAESYLVKRKEKKGEREKELSSCFLGVGR